MPFLQAVLIAAAGGAESEAQVNRWIVQVLLIGIAIMGVGGTTLYLAFRGFGASKGRSGDLRPLILLLALIAFLMVCSVVLLRISIAR